jgi:BirA family transcriptional regulator, biotin operon repressor / biotin---[acetyl-CoA-carboxylase] ligase
MTTGTSSSSSTCSGDDETCNNNERQQLFFSNKYDVLDLRVVNEPIGSTQDETKRLLAGRHESSSTTSTRDDDSSSSSQRILAVLARQQENGRGTQGRKWEGRQGNVYVTVAIPFSQIPVTITLLPLQIGVLIAQTLKEFLSSTTATTTTTTSADAPKVTVKWPNDVLIDQRKIAGVLIENWLAPAPDHAAWFLIGIGVNVAYAPTLPEGIRPAICLQELYDTASHETALPESTAQEIGTQLVHSFVDWIESGKTMNNNRLLAENRVLEEWKALSEFGQVYKIRETGEEVFTLDIHRDGRLKVRGADGQERLLAADYLH